jgi:hypothetical protein
MSSQRRTISENLSGELRITQSLNGGSLRIEQRLVDGWKPLAISDNWMEAHQVLHQLDSQLQRGRHERRGPQTQPR